jgi:hypothetical protein|tara:strand:+ start:44 stop:304 length:261 start_codon:yes stop_codon:yes gene_type:complete
MGKLIFRYTEEDNQKQLNREANEVELSVPDDMNINEFKVVCVRLAQALGYQQKSIESGFGDLVYGDESTDELKKLIREITEPKNVK